MTFLPSARALSLAGVAGFVGLALTVPLAAFPPPMPLAERVKAADVVVHVELKRIVVLDDLNKGRTRVAAHLVVLEVLKGNLTENNPTIEMTIRPDSLEGDLVSAPKPGRYLLLLAKGKGGALVLFRPNVFAWMDVDEDMLRKAKLQLLP